MFAVRALRYLKGKPRLSPVTDDVFPILEKIYGYPWIFQIGTYLFFFNGDFEVEEETCTKSSLLLQR